MEIKELQKKGKTELMRILKDSREKLRELRFSLTAGKVKNVRQIRKIKKEISRIMTILSE